MRELKTARVIAGMTQADLAEKSGYSRQTIMNIETGKVIPRIRTLQKLAEAMGMRVKVTFEEADDERHSDIN